MNHIFLFMQDAYICNLADGNSLYSTTDNSEEVKTTLKKNFELLQVWFYENNVILSSRKYHY